MTSLASTKEGAGARSRAPMQRPQWKKKPLRFLCRLNPTKSEVSHLQGDTEVSFVPMEAVHEFGGLDLSQSRAIETVSQGYTYFRDGDVLIAKITPCFENGKGSLAASLEGGIGFGTTELHVLRCGEEIDPRFLFYLTLSHDFRHRGAGWMYGAGGQKRVPEEFLRNYLAAFPARVEQQAIAAWLDDRTKRIDDLIAAKRRLIELLAERRSALITRAVTKGLDPATPMKPSGVDWLGDIPTHWRAKRLRYLCKIQTGDKDTVDAVEEGDYPFFVRSQTVERISSFTFDCEAVLTAGDGVGVGKVFHHVDGRFDVHQRVYVMHGFREIVGRFLFYYLREQFYKVALEGSAKSTVDSLRRHMFTDFIVALPPLKEQAAIVDELDRVCARMLAIECAATGAIERLSEYRQALITAAVTGQIDVGVGT